MGLYAGRDNERVQIYPTMPAGSIVAWYGRIDEVPIGWTLCDGTNGAPDLRGVFILGAGGQYPVGSTGGADKVTLGVDNLPSHSHGVDLGITMACSEAPTEFVASIGGSMNTESTGGNVPHENMPPYLALYYIMKLEEDE